MPANMALDFVTDPDRAISLLQNDAIYIKSLRHPVVKLL